MNEVKEYQLVMETGSKNLNEKINALIKEGWQPLGGSSIAWGKVDTMPNTLNNKVIDGYMTSQVMVRY